MKPKRRAKTATVATIRQASIAEMEQFYAMRMHHYIAEKDGVALAMGTLSNVNGRLWGWFDVKSDLTSAQRMSVVWALMRGLRRINQSIYVTSNERLHPRAMDLLRLVGFRTTGEIVQGFQVWVWMHQPDPDVRDPFNIDETRVQ